MTMKAYIRKTKKTIEPFGEHPKDCLIGNKRLSEIQDYALRTAGLSPVHVTDMSTVHDEDEYIVVGDHVFFTARLLEEFIGKSRNTKRRTVCALKPGVTTIRTVTSLQDVKEYPDRVEYDLWYVPEERFRASFQPVVIDADMVQEGINVPEHFCGEERYMLPVTEKAVCHIDHWVNIWAINVLFSLSIIARLKAQSRLKLLSLAWKARSLNKWKILAGANVIGRDCDIHPTAYIEGSHIGDNVTIGAGSVIRQSVLGSDVNIGSSVTVEASVLGEKSAVLSGHILYSVLYPGGFSVAQMISASLTGRDSFVGSGVVLTDYRIDGRNITVVKGDKTVDTSNRVIGCCLGHGVYLGSGCVVAPGRMIPNSIRLAPEKERIFTRYASGLMRTVEYTASSANFKKNRGT